MTIATVIDIRPDRFLHEMRDGKSVEAAAEAAGMSLQELDDLIRGNPKFGLATSECIYEHAEEQMRATAAKIVEGAKEFARLIEEKADQILAESLQEIRDAR